MPKELKQQNLFIKKSLNRHLGVGGPSTSDHSENSRTSTPTVSEDESGSKTSRRGGETGDTEHRQTPPSRPLHGLKTTADIAADERAVRLKTEQFQQALNDSANEAESSSVSTSSDGRDSRTADIKPSKRPIKGKRDHPGRGSYRAGFRGKFGRDGGRMGHGHGHFPRGPRPMMPFQHRPPPPMHMLEQLSQSPRDSAFIPSPRRTPRHSESSSCGSPRLYSGTGQTPPQSPRHFYESPIQSPLRHHISPYNSPPRHPASPIPRMIPPEHMIRPHPSMMARQIPMPGSIPIPMPPQPDVRAFSGTPPPQFHPMNNPHAAHMQPMTPEQHRMMAAMQQQAMEHQHQQQQQFEHHQIAHMNAMKFNKPSQPDSLAQMVQSYSKGQNVTLTPEQIAQVMQYCNMMGQPVNPNMMPGNQNVISHGWMQQGGHQPEMMMNPVPHPNLEMPPQMMPHPVQMGQQVHPMFLQQQQIPGFLPGQAPPGQHMSGSPIPGHLAGPNQSMPMQTMPGQSLAGPPVSGHMPGAISSHHFLQNQQIMIPRPIHPEMGNTSNITAPQNRHAPLVTPTHSMPPSQFGLHNIPVSSVASTLPHLMPNTEVVAPSPPPLPQEDTNNSVPVTTTIVPLTDNSSVRSQNAYSGIPLPVTSSKDTGAPVPSSEGPAMKTSSTAPPVTPVKQSAKTPGIIRLPQDHQLPTEEDLLKSPDAAGTPVNMKKNYWQNRQKSSESAAEKKGELTPPKEEQEKTSNTPSPEPTPEIKTEKTKLPHDPTNSASKYVAEKPIVPQETPKKKSEKPIRAKGFNLSDLSELVTKTVTHNNNIPKTDISVAANSGSVEVVLNQGYRRTHSPCQARAVEPRERRDSDTWRPLSKSKPDPEEGPGGSWRTQDNAASSSAALEDDPERTKALQEAQAKDLSTGQQIQYAIEKLQKQSRVQTVSESSSKGVKEEVAGEEAWYDEEDEDRIDCFDLTI
ncbi:hypothetical protein ACHWQZ_G004491 [Mnemiopsis leidyi]